MLKKITQIALLYLLIISTGCGSTKEIHYFQSEKDESKTQSFTFEAPVLQMGDLIQINVSSVDKITAEPFNLVEASGVGTAKPIPYRVNIDGFIYFPVLGEIKASGLTTEELRLKLTQDLAPYLKNAIVNIRLINFKITVLGEVNAPGSYTIPDERISIVEALGLAGDLTIYGERNGITLIKEKDGVRTFIPIDLTNKELFMAPHFYLSQNDMLYIPPNKTKVNSSRTGSSTGVVISAISILISLVAIFI